MSSVIVGGRAAWELKRRAGWTVVAALCGGGGVGDALIITVPADGDSR